MSLAAHIIIEGTLPDLNSEIEAAKKVGFVGKPPNRKRVPGLGYANQKRKWTENVAWYVKQQARHVHIETFCSVVAIWYLQDRRKDPDNVYFAQKYLYDGMVAGGILPADSFKNTRGGITHLVDIDQRRPRVEIYVFEDFNLADLVLPFIQKHNFNKKIQYENCT